MVFQFCTVMDSTSEPGENDESDDDDEVGEFEKYVWVPGELKSGLGYPEQRSVVSGWTSAFTLVDLILVKKLFFNVNK